MLTRRSGLVCFGVAAVALLFGSGSRAQAQNLVGRWEHDGKFGVSFLHFHHPVQLPSGALEGRFEHHVFLDNGTALRGHGTYILHPQPHHQGHLVLIFSDGHRTGMHEHTFGHNLLVLDHHGIRRTYVRR
jgi:hypothetical protein